MRETSFMRPPRILRAIIGATLPENDHSLIDELDAMYAERARTHGRFAATAWYTRQTAGFVVRTSADAAARFVRASASTAIDLRVAVRAFRRRPVYVASFALTLAIGVAVVATTYSIANWVLLRPVPGIRAPDALATLQLGMPDAPAHVSWDVSQLDVMTLRDRLSADAQLATMSRIDVDLRVGDAVPRRIGGEMVSANYFALFGTTMAAGRAFTATEATDPSSELVAIVSRELATHIAEGAAAGDAVGKTVTVNGNPLRIIGVTERGFRGAELPGRADIWVPLTALSVVDPSAPRNAAARRGYGVWRRLFVRLAPGTSLARVEAVANAVVDATRKEFKAHSYNALTQRYQVFQGVGLDPSVRSTVRSTLSIIAAAAALLLALSIANVVNLALTNETARGPILNIQRALGATRMRLARARTVEAVILAAAATVLAIGSTIAFGRVFDSTRLSEYGASLTGLSIDLRVVSFTLAVSLVAALAAATFAALLTRMPSADDVLRRGSTIGRPAHRIRSTLAGLQVALSLLLLVAAGLLGRTVENLRRIELGFPIDGISTFALDPVLHGVGMKRLESLARDMVGDFKRRGIGGAGFIAPSPLNSSFVTASLRRSSSDSVVIGAGFYVTPGFLTALGARVLGGEREWRADSGTVVITRAYATELFPELPPAALVGRRLPSRRGIVTVAAVIENVQLSDITKAPVPTLFMPLSEALDWMSVRGFVRETRRANVAATIREVIARNAPDVPLFDLRSARDLVELQFAERKSMALAARALAVFGVVLAALGLYGVLSTIVAASQRELAIRVALGASPSQVRARVLRVGMIPVISGILAGALASSLVVRALRSQLFGLDGLDVASFIGAMLLLVTVAILACLVPARRATNVSPSEALRAE